MIHEVGIFVVGSVFTDISKERFPFIYSVEQSKQNIPSSQPTYITKTHLVILLHLFLGLPNGRLANNPHQSSEGVSWLHESFS